MTIIGIVIIVSAIVSAVISIALAVARACDTPIARNPAALIESVGHTYKAAVGRMVDSGRLPATTDPHTVFCHEPVLLGSGSDNPVRCQLALYHYGRHLVDPDDVLAHGYAAVPF